MRRITLLLLMVAFIFVPYFLPSSNSAQVTPVLTGLDFPVALKFAPDGRIFFNEKNTGNIRVVLPNMTLLSSPFATVSPLYNGGEAGLLGIALDPNFSTNGSVYVYYTYRDGSSFTHGAIRRYTAVGNVGTDPTTIFDVTSSLMNTQYHNGGYIKFGPDGKLYAQVGEFHSGQQAQNPGSTDGKMLRMNSDGNVPSDNPFPGSLVYALGIRNAFGFDFDTSNNRLIATEAGPTTEDEINIIVRGGNYGWPTCTGPCHNPSFIDPIVDFPSIVTPTGIATVGPNVYYFGEWTTGNLVRLELSSSGSVVSMSQVYNQQGGIIAVEMRSDGKLYYTSQNGIYYYDDIPVQTQPTPPPILVWPWVLVGAPIALALIFLVQRHRKKIETQNQRVEVLDQAFTATAKGQVSPK